MLSKKSKYAIKALVFLARHFDNNTPMTISKIAEVEKIPRKFLEAILVELRNNGLLHSRMGSQGGYLLARRPEEIELSHIIRVSGGPIAMLPCVSLNFYERCEECSIEEACGLRNVILEVREATVKILSNTTLRDVIRREDELRKKLGLGDL